LAIIQWTDVTASRPQEGVGVFIHDHLTTPRWGGMARRSTADQMIDRTPTRGNCNRFDLMIAIGFAGTRSRLASGLCGVSRQIWRIQWIEWGFVLVIAAARYGCLSGVSSLRRSSVCIGKAAPPGYRIDAAVFFPNMMPTPLINVRSSRSNCPRQSRITGSTKAGQGALRSRLRTRHWGQMSTKTPLTCELRAPVRAREIPSPPFAASCTRSLGGASPMIDGKLSLGLRAKGDVAAP